MEKNYREEAKYARSLELEISRRNNNFLKHILWISDEESLAVFERGVVFWRATARMPAPLKTTHQHHPYFFKLVKKAAHVRTMNGLTLQMQWLAQDGRSLHVLQP